MKLRFRETGRHQPDPFIFWDGEKYYLYVTGAVGVEAYVSDAPEGLWESLGVVCSTPGCCEFWAPCIISEAGRYYLYVSCREGEDFEHLWVYSADSPCGPFSDRKKLYDRFAIDPHVVRTDAGLFLFYAENNQEGDKIGTRLFVDRLLDPTTPQHLCREILCPDFEEEIFERKRFGDGRDWYTLEGPFWFRKGDYQYLMYSGGCYQNDTYHLGYATARSDESDLTRVHWVKHTNEGRFDPFMMKNGTEEGTGHNSVLALGERFFVFYHARDLLPASGASEYREARTARMREMLVADGRLTLI